MRRPTDAREKALHYRVHMRGWQWHWTDVVYDAAPPVVLLALGLIDAYSGAFTAPIDSAPSVVAVIPGAISCLALAFRRYRPLLTLVIVLLATVVVPLILSTTFTYWDEFAVWIVALYSCARHLRLSRAFVALGVIALGMVALPFEFAELRDFSSMFFNSVLLVIAFSVGLLARSWAEYRERAIRSAAERAVAEERASHAERARIARELHDVIAHTITVIVMQAGGARLASASDPSIAASTLTKIEELGRASLAELRNLLPLLRDEPEDTPSSPQPTLADVTALCDRMRGLGLPIDAHLGGELETIPLGLQLTGYRVVQEGLTNVLKHSGTVETTVRVMLDSSARVVIEVSNKSADDAPRLGGAGRGLAGLRERVLLAGGSFSAAQQPDGAFLLHAELPTKTERS